MTAGRPVGMPRRSSGATCSRRRTRRRGRPAGTDRGCSSSGPIETSWYLSGDKSSKQGPSAPNLADECILPRGRGGGPGHPVPTCRGSRYLVTSGGSRTRRVDWTVALDGADRGRGGPAPVSPGVIVACGRSHVSVASPVGRTERSSSRAAASAPPSRTRRRFGLGHPSPVSLAVRVLGGLVA